MQTETINLQKLNTCILCLTQRSGKSKVVNTSGFSGVWINGVPLYIVYFSIIISMSTIVICICHVERLEATSQLKHASHLCGHKKLKLDDRKNFQFKKRGIGNESEKYANKLEIKKYGNKLKMDLSDHRTKKLISEKLILRHLLSLF